MHDAREPLCVDGVVSNGVWGPARPQVADGKKEPASPKDDRTEELKMDLRWHIPHVTGMIARAFGLPSATNLWLFHAAPSSTSEEPLNTAAFQNGQTLKDIQNTALCNSSFGKKPLTIHAVEIPFPPGQLVADNNQIWVCVRFFDDAVREVGSFIATVPPNGTMADVLTESRHHLQQHPEWNIPAAGPWRVLEVSESRLQEVYRPDALIRSSPCLGRLNIFYNCLRVEADPDPVNLPEGSKTIEIYHCDRASQQAFAMPMLMTVEAGENAGSLKARCKAKLRVADTEFKSWRLVRLGKTGRMHLKDDESWDSDNSPEVKLCLEHVHPNPSNCLTKQSRHNKPLMIK
jgi:hypothetical protein